MADMRVDIRLRAIDNATKTIRSVERALRDLERAGVRTRPGQSRGAGGVPVVSHQEHSRRIDAQAAAVSRARGSMGVSPLGLSPAFLGAGAAGYAGAKATKEAMDFESVLSRIQQKAGATDEQMAGVRRQIEAMAQDKAIGASLDDITGGFERAAAAGVPLNEMSQFVRVVAKAAPALDMTGEALGNTLSQLEGASLIARDGSERFLDLVNALEDAGTSNASDILDFMLRAGASAKIFGIATEETAALGGAMVDLGINSAEAGTAVNAILSKLTSPKGLSKQGQKALKGLYGSTEAWTELVAKDADAAFVDLLERMRDLDKEARSGAALDIVGLEHADVLQRLIEGLGKVRSRLRLAKDESSWLGNLDKTAALKMKTTEAQLQVVQRRLRTLAISAGEIGLSGLDSALAGVNRILDHFQKYGDPFEHIKAGAEGLAEGLGFASFSDLMADVGTKIGAAADALGKLMGIDTSATNLTSTFEAWREAGQSVVEMFQAVELGMLKLESAKLGFAQWGDDMGANGLSQTPKERKAWREKIDSEAKAVNDRIAAIERAQANQEILDAAHEKTKDRPSARSGEASSLRSAEVGGWTDPERVKAQSTRDPTVVDKLTRNTGAIPVPQTRPAAVEAVGQRIEEAGARVAQALDTAAATITPSAPDKPASQRPRMKLPPINPPVWDDTPPPPADPRGTEALRNALQAGRATVAPSVDTSEIVTAKAELDAFNNLTAVANVALNAAPFMGPAGQVTATLGEIARTVTATADLNIGPLMSKVATAKAAIRSLNGMSVTAGGGTSNYGAHRRSQFAPATPGGGT
ncbi:phage tail tape measure protein, TP901 family, core region [Fulvimarina manganoxydans]|uniref:Phage tail tape measure protein, TP901 family, core region n=1 Tax=Fulvimarina manganoxydans TaxID=937218 RepID=A0A1W2BBP6_9HYPH|nr:phage tail tape measure protein [Fulvimarina manganoxydans]SMC70264.1 phage tail tape measure protein, TP901 family, core region [Fulvimarina manganoxydans]